MEPILFSSKKNALQEYYQRTFPRWGSDGKHILPIYEHTAVEEGWQCTLTLPDTHVPFTAVGQTKKEADQVAAGLALQAIRNGGKSSSTIDNRQPPPKWGVVDGSVNHEPTQRDWRFPGCVLVLIDLENAPRHTSSKWDKVKWDCSKVEAFVGKLSSHATKDLASIYPFVDKFTIIESGMKDAVDHAISVRAGQWLESMKHIEYYLNGEEGCVYDDALFIVSRDRFAPALVDVMRQHIHCIHTGGAIAPTIVHCINIDECFKKLEENTQ